MNDLLAKLRDEIQKEGVVWLSVGYIGQMVFFGRFFVQWVVSERRGQSVIPISFWFLSIIGSFVLLIYAIHRRDPVFIPAQAFGFVVYVRNLMLLKKTPPGVKP